MTIAEKWADRMPGVGEAGGDWKQRARRAEAEAACYRTLMHAHELKRYAAVEEVTRSLSWRVTKPLRAINRLRRSVPDSDGDPVTRAVR
jgi:hypothetical protein